MWCARVHFAGAVQRGREIFESKQVRWWHHSNLCGPAGGVGYTWRAPEEFPGNDAGARIDIAEEHKLASSHAAGSM